MRHARHATLAGVFLLIAPPAAAQDDDGGMIQRFLQDSLSSAGREVTISGFEGLLAGAARLGELTIADDQGVWLILRDAELDWSRVALLRGNLSVETLRAGELIVLRLPEPAPDDGLPEPPKAEASGFALPELPVSIRIDRFAIDRADLREPVAGEAAVLNLEGTMRLADGEGQVDLEARRIDGRNDFLSLNGGFANETGVLSIDVELQEAAGGLISQRLPVEDTPSIDLKIAGEGPLTDFAADIGLRTDGEPRLTGTVTRQGDGAGNSTFLAEIGGDIRPLLPADFHTFFGDDLRLVANANRSSDGTFDLPEISISAQSLELEASASLGPDGLPTAFTIDGDMARADGEPLRLPMSGPATYLGRVTLDAAYDRSVSERWTLTADITGVDTADADIESLNLDGVGRITTDGGARINGDFLFDVAGLSLADPALAQAAGTAVSGGLGLNWQQGGALDVTRLFVDGEDFGVTALGRLNIENRSLQISGEARVRADDLARFSTVAGRPLTGEIAGDLSGQGDLLGGQFAATVELSGEGLSIGQETADRLLDGPVSIRTAARRDTDGTVLDNFELRSRGVTADGSGRVGGGRSDIGFEAALTDVGLVLPGHTGTLTLGGTARETDPGDWQVGLDLEGPYDLAGSFDGRVFPGESALTLDLSLPDIAPLVPGHEGAVTVTGTAAEAAAGKWDVDLDVGGPYALTAAVAGRVAPGESDIALDIALPDIAPLVPGHSGAVALSGSAAETANGGWQVALDGSGPYEASVALDGSIGGGPGTVNFTAGLPDVAPLVPGLSGPLQAKGTASDAGDGLWQIDVDASGPLDGLASVDGVVGGGRSDVALKLSVPDLSPLVPQINGPLEAEGRAAEAGDGRWNVDFDVDGPQGSTARLDGAVGATGSDVALALAIPEIAAFAPGLRGAVAANATAAQDANGAWDLGLDATGPYSSTVTAEGTYGGDASDLSFEAALPDVGALVPTISGPLSVSGTTSEADAGAWDVTLDAGLPYNGTASVAGRVAAENTAVDLRVNMPSIAPFAPGISGGFAAEGSVSQAPEGYAVTLATNGPQGVSSTIGGTVASDFSTVALSANGTAPLGLANGVLEPNLIDGTASFDIAVNGAPSLEAVSGTVNVAGAEFALPTAGYRFDGIAVQLGISGATLQIDASANSPAGGNVAANGTVQITGGMTANLEARLNQFVLTDPALYETTLDGTAAISGPLAGGANISGNIRVGRTEIRIPDGGLGFGGAIPNMRHLNEPSAVNLTRARAGLIESERKSAAPAGSGPSYGLNVVVNAPEQIFIRGRGLDTELGGGVVITGTTTNPRTVGEIEVIRGRLDILGQRLDMTEGTISMAGGLQPYLDLVATSSRDDFEFQARISGPVDDPQFDLSSVPDLPEDEVLARFLFGKSVTDLSALQAVQMANALATLTGRGGVGLLGNVREGLGLDDLDLATTDDGGTELRAGRYISDNIYTEFVANEDGETEVDINIDLTRSFTVKGTADSQGDSSIGIYFERDY